MAGRLTLELPTTLGSGSGRPVPSGSGRGRILTSLVRPGINATQTTVRRRSGGYLSSTRRTSRTGGNGSTRTGPPRSAGADLPTEETRAGVTTQETKGSPADLVTTASADQAGSNNVDRIREILFGGQMREYERKFARLEERLLKESNDLREDLKRGFAALESYFRKEVDSLNERLTVEYGERTDAVKEIGQELKALTQSVERRTAQLDEQSARGQRELRQQIFEQSKSASAEIRQSAEELSAIMARETQELRYDKADRAALATLFSELALRLSGEFVLPGEEP